MTASAPKPLDSGLTSASTACPATMASNALPPDSRTRAAALVASCFIDETAYCVPRTTGRNVRLDVTAPSDFSWALNGHTTSGLSSNAVRRQINNRLMACLRSAGVFWMRSERPGLAVFDSHEYGRASDGRSRNASSTRIESSGRFPEPEEPG